MTNWASSFWLGLAATFAATAAPARPALEHSPLRFERSSGAANFVARGQGFAVGVSAAESWVEWRDGHRRDSAVVRTRLSGASAAASVEAVERLPGATNYLVGNAANWRTDIASFGRVRSRGVYPGIDLVFHGEQGRLEYDFVLAPGADPAEIRMVLSGHRSARIDDKGELVIGSTAGDIRWKRPEIYQYAGGRRRPVEGKFKLGAGGLVTFALGAYDRSRELVIDPVLAYATYLGGSNNEGARGLGLDSAGNVYLAGNTTSTNLPVVAPYQANFGGMTANVMGGDAYVAKYSPAGALIYLTYLGGSGDDTASALAVDSAGNVYVTGCTTSSDFPTLNAYQSHFAGLGGSSYLRTGDAFVTKLSAAGNKLVYSTFLGGSRDDAGTAIAIDSTGAAYITGATGSQDFPVTASAFQSRLKGIGGEPIKQTGYPSWDPGDAFVAKLDPTGSQLVFSTYLGGTNDDVAWTLALDASNNVYVGGCTISRDFPTTAGALQRTYGGTEEQNEFMNLGDGFVAKLTANGSALMYSTYFGGPGDDCVSALAVDRSGNVYMTGSTSSSRMQTTAGAFQPAYAGYQSLPFLIEQLYGDAFVAKLNPSGSGLIYLSYLGGSANDAGTAIAVDSGGIAYVTGFTDSTDFPQAGGPLQSRMAGHGGQGQFMFYGDAFLTVVNPAGTSLAYSSYYGGNFDDNAFAIALDGKGGVYVAGGTVSTTLTTTATAAQRTYGGGRRLNGYVNGDAFYAVFSGFATAAPAITSVGNAAGGSSSIAPNAWTEIKGSALAGSTRIWGDADFVNGQMPTSLDGVSVTMNGKSAYVYYISPTQVNVLTPPDLTAGPVQVVLTNKGVAGLAFTAQSASYSPSFFAFNGGPYLAATHADGRLIGPTSLFAGLTTPAAPGETIILYANGYGPVNPPVVSGSAVQSGTLPQIPAVRIGGQTATVRFAGLISPGLYQFNVVVPDPLPDGDNAVVSVYANLSTQSGALLTIQR